MADKSCCLDSFQSLDNTFFEIAVSFPFLRLNEGGDRISSNEAKFFKLSSREEWNRNGNDEQRNFLGSLNFSNFLIFFTDYFAPPLGRGSAPIRLIQNGVDRLSAPLFTNILHRYR